MEITRLFTNVCSNDLATSKAFYTSLFSLEIEYDSDWFVHLLTPDKKLEMGIIDQSHDLVPTQIKGNSGGSYLTFVVEDVDELFSKAQALNYTVLKSPEMTFYGQKRMLLIAPEGTVCDVSSPC